MKKLKPLFGFECRLDDDGLVEVDIECEFPEDNSNCLKFFRQLEKQKIIDSKIDFPIRLIHWKITINPTDRFTIMNYFTIDGLKKIVEEHKSKLIGKTTFVKPQVEYNKKVKYPNLNLHFYQVSDEVGMMIFDIDDMIESCFIQYENTKQFTAKRLADLEPYVNPMELQIMSFLPMELVMFNTNGEIEDFQQHLLAKKSVGLPF
jgi:hypothetical protein